MDTKHFLPVMGILCGLSAASAAELPAATHFRREVQPILTEYCFDCHADGANKGGISFDQFGGKAYWDHAGIVKKPSVEVPGLGDIFWTMFTSPEFQYIR